MEAPHPFQTSVPDNPFAASRRRQLVTRIAGGVVIIILLALALLLYTRSRQSGILLLKPTEGLTVTINGNEISGQETEQGRFIPLYAGTYRVQVSKTDYQPFVQDMQIQPGIILHLRPAFSLLPSVRGNPLGTVDYVRSSPDQKVVYYLGDARTRLYRLEVVPQTQIALTDQPLSGVRDVQWSSNPNVAMVVQNDGVYLHEIPRFDFKNQIFLKVAASDMLSPKFDPNDENRVAAVYQPSSGEHSLVVSDKRFTNLTRLTDTRAITNPTITWSPTSNHIALVATGGPLQERNLWLYTLENGNLTQLTEDGRIEHAVFSPDGRILLYEYRTPEGKLQRRAYTLENGEHREVNGSIPLSRIAWKDASSFYEPNPGSASLTLQNLNSNREEIPISLPISSEIQSTFYFPEVERLVLATNDAVYVVVLANP